jgi:hypothetical protein
MPCGFGNILACASDAVSSVGRNIVGDAVSSAWQQVCQSFADAASSLLKEFAQAFVAIPDPDLASPGIRSVYGVSLGIAAVVAALLLIGQVIRTGFTHDGSAIVTGLTGIAKAALAFLLTLTIGTAALDSSSSGPIPDLTSGTPGRCRSRFSSTPTRTPRPPAKDQSCSSRTASRPARSRGRGCDRACRAAMT